MNRKTVFFGSLGVVLVGLLLYAINIGSQVLIRSEQIEATLTSKTLASSTLTSPIIGTQVTLDQSTEDYTLTWADPAAARAISISDPLGTDVFVWVDALQTLTQKTLTTPTIGDFQNSTHDHADAAGGGAVVGLALVMLDGGTEVSTATATATWANVDVTASTAVGATHVILEILAATDVDLGETNQITVEARQDGSSATTNVEVFLLELEENVGNDNMDHSQSQEVIVELGAGEIFEIQYTIGGFQTASVTVDVKGYYIQQ